MLTNAANIKAANAPNRPTGNTFAKTRGARSWVFNVSESNSLNDSIKYLGKLSSTLVVTLGKNGSLIYNNGKYYICEIWLKIFAM